MTTIKKFVKEFFGTGGIEKEINKFIDENNYEIADIVINRRPDNYFLNDFDTHGYVTYFSRRPHDKNVEDRHSEIEQKGEGSETRESMSEFLNDKNPKIVEITLKSGKKVQGKLICYNKEKGIIRIETNSLDHEYNVEDIAQLEKI